MKPLTLFYSNDPEALGTGSFKPITDRPDIYHPDKFTEYESRVSAWFERESVVNEEDIKMSSYTKGVSGLIRFDLPILKKSGLAFSIKDFSSDYTLKQDNDLIINQDQYENTLSFGFQPNAFISAGAGLRTDTGKSGTESFYSFSIRPIENIRFGYRELNKNMAINAALIADGSLAEVDTLSNRHIKELSFRMDMPSFLQMDASFNMNDPNNEITLTFFPKEKLQIAYHHSDYSVDLSNDININGMPGGHIETYSKLENNSVSLIFSPENSRERFFAGIKKSEFSMKSAGKVDAAFILDFWEDLLAGERFFNADYSMNSTNYHIGMEYHYTKRTTFRGGLQYIYIEPEGNIEHWTPTPFIKIGKLDDEVIPFPYEKAGLAGLSLGFSYRLKRVEISYGISQLVPIFIDKNDDSSEDDIKSESSDLKDLWEWDFKDPGGNIQTIEVTYYF